MANLPDPSTLSDEDLDKILNGEDLEEVTDDTETGDADDEEETSDESKTEDEKTEEEEESEEKSDDDTSDDEEAKKPSRRESLRVQKLLEKMKQGAPAAPKTSTGLDYSKELDADPELIKRLEDDRTNATKTAANEAITAARTMQWETLLQIDTPAIEQKYAFMNPQDTEHFHPAVADSLTRQYLDMVGFDPETKTVNRPNVRWSDYVESQYELATEIAATMVADTKKNITKQAAKTALRPDGSSAKKLNLNKAPQDMSDEELDTFLANQGL